MDRKHEQELVITPKIGFPMLFLVIATFLLSIVLMFSAGFILEARPYNAPGIILLILGILMLLFGWIPAMGLKVVKPQEALVLTKFGKYYGTIRKEGFYYTHPFAFAFNPTLGAISLEVDDPLQMKEGKSSQKVSLPKKAISLKVLTLNNNKQKVNDLLGNPVEIGVVVIWRVTNTAKAVFNVDNFGTYLSIQCDSALRNIARLYPYDVADDGEEMTLRGSSQAVAEKLQAELQQRVEIAGIEVLEARITHLAYAPEIAAAMLQRQQASAIIDARKMIVEGAVGMVEDALTKLSENNVVELDEERKAAMVSNLLVVLCANRDATPVINSGSLY